LICLSGYSSYASLSGMFNDFAVMCTWEGDNTVMAQQTARYLIKSFQQAMHEEKGLSVVVWRI
jgi:acyl-CoA oxidase